MQRTTRRILIVAAAATAFFTVGRSTADVIWFDATDADSFTHLTQRYQTFLGSDVETIDFTGWRPGTVARDQYATDFGVRFENAAGGPHSAFSGVRVEGGAIAEHITGYDGSYRPHGDPVYVRFDNHHAASPFTIHFEQPVATVGAFVGMGVQGDVHSLTVSAYDAADDLIGQQTVESWLWESSSRKQNYESFFGVQADDAVISRVELLNDSTVAYAHSLIVDDISFGTAGIPEPSTLLLLTAGAVLMTRRRG